MPEDTKVRADDDGQKKLDMVLAHLDSLHKRMDAAEEERKADRARLDAACTKMDSFEKKADQANAEEEEKKQAAARKDAEDKAKADAAAKEEEDKKKADAARADSATNIDARIAAEVKKHIPATLPEEERAKFVAVQVNAERVAQAFGDSAPRWMNGELLPDYKRRLAGKYKQHSSTWKDADLAKIDASVLDQIVSQIYADALTAAATPSSVPAGVLREMVEPDRTGRRITRFVGDPESCWGVFKQPVRGVTGMRPQVDR